MGGGGFPLRLLSTTSRSAPGILSLRGGFTPCRHLRPSSGREHTVVLLIQSGADDYWMNETGKKPTTGTRCPTLFDTWHGIFHMPSRILHCFKSNVNQQLNLSGGEFLVQSYTSMHWDNKLIKYKNKGRISHCNDPLCKIAVKEMYKVVSFVCSKTFSYAWGG